MPHPPAACAATCAHLTHHLWYVHMFAHLPQLFDFANPVLVMLVTTLALVPVIFFVFYWPWSSKPLACNEVLLGRWVKLLLCSYAEECRSNGADPFGHPQAGPGSGACPPVPPPPVQQPAAAADPGIGQLMAAIGSLVQQLEKKEAQEAGHAHGKSFLAAVASVRDRLFEETSTLVSSLSLFCPWSPHAIHEVECGIRRMHSGRHECAQPASPPPARPLFWSVWLLHCMHCMRKGLRPVTFVCSSSHSFPLPSTVCPPEGSRILFLDSPHFSSVAHSTLSFCRWW